MFHPWLLAYGWFTSMVRNPFSKKVHWITAMVLKHYQKLGIPVEFTIP